QTDSAVGSSWA
ncbi:ESAT-6 like protein EsxN, partial [Mycobacterium tuberculosis MD15963]